MDEEIKKLLLQNAEIARKNLEILKKLERALFWQKISKIIKWTFIAVLMIVAYLQIQPYINFLSKFYQNPAGILENLESQLK